MLRALSHLPATPATRAALPATCACTESEVAGEGSTAHASSPAAHQVIQQLSKVRGQDDQHEVCDVCVEAGVVGACGLACDQM